MLVYVVRHAWAGDSSDPRWPDDAQRPLTSDGRKRFRAVVKKLVKRGLAPSVIATSPLARCRQTAEILAEYVNTGASLTLLDALAPGARLGDLLPWLEHHADSGEICLVGHAPDVGAIVTAMIGVGSCQIDFAKGATACIEFDDVPAPGQGVLRWLATAKLLNC